MVPTFFTGSSGRRAPRAGRLPLPTQEQTSPRRTGWPTSTSSTLTTPAEQIERLVDGLTSAGFTVVNDYNPNDRPVTLAVTDGRESREFRVFCWNVTTGGHGRRPDERRVQTTRPGNVPLHLAGTLTLVLGYHEDLGVFAAWDAEKHPNPSESASLQIPLETLERAAEGGFAARERPLGPPGVVEVVVAFQPELLRDYLQILPSLDVSDPVEGSATAAAVSGEERPIEELPGSAERRRAISNVSRAVRNAQFRVRVLRAYGNRCAFCDLAASLCQAAHIRPVHLGGVDQVHNGVAACPTHHLAFDRGLLIVGDDLSIQLNNSRLAEVGADDDDREALQAGLRQTLRRPAEPSLQPSRENLAAHRALWEEGRSLA
jgi:putative restriction endonuclease